MPDYCRLRQICLVAADLPRAVADTQAIFGVKLAYQDPHVRRYGLQNALFPFGLAFVEIVSPVESDTAAGRFLERGGGSGGYMAIFNCSDPQRRGRHANALGVRTAHAIDHPGFHAVQLHPRDCRAAMIEFDHTDGEEDLRGPYGPAGGTGWTATTLGVAGLSPIFVSGNFISPIVKAAKDPISSRDLSSTAETFAPGNGSGIISNV